MWQHEEALRIESAKEVNRISRFIARQLKTFKRDGAVVGLSGGIDSALCAELCVAALGNGRVLGVILPEKESDPRSAE